MLQTSTHEIIDPAEFDCTRFEILSGGSIKGRSPVCDAVLDHWRELCADDLIPAREMIRLAGLRRHAAHIAILGIVPDPATQCGLRLPVRLTGTAIVKHYGEWTGREICDVEHWAGPARRICHMVKQMLALRGPVMSHVEGVTCSMPLKHSHTLYLPLASDGTRIDKALMVLDIHYHDVYAGKRTTG